MQPREVAQKAIKEIKNVPPKLMLYSLAGAAALILVIGIGGHNLHSHSEQRRRFWRWPRDRRRANSSASRMPARQYRRIRQRKCPPQPSLRRRRPPQIRHPLPRNLKLRRRRRALLSVRVSRGGEPLQIIPGQLTIDSTPQGAQVQIDGKSDTTWVTPLTLTNIQPGQHSVIVSKTGYSGDSRTLNVASGNRATTVVHLAKLMATLVVKSDPPGANIYVDGRNMVIKTPGQVSVEKGQHVVLVRMSGYIDETMNAQFALGQTFNFSPTLRPLGNTDNLKTVGKMSKLFGGRGQAGEAILSIRTQPKGAQIAVNQHLVEKPSPADVLLDPGNYVIDITMSGYAPVHKVVTADKGGKVVVDEVLQRQ